MTILSAVASAATRLGLDIPTLLFGSTDRDMIEMQEVANESARAIAEAFDWQALKTIATLTGAGAQTDFDLPTDYDRMLTRASLWSSNRAWSADPVSSPDAWLGIEVNNSPAPLGRWILYGGQIHLQPSMAAAETVKFFYISANLVTAANATMKPLFTADADIFRLSERLLKLAIIWRWKAAKALPYAEDLANYEEQLDKAMTKDAGSKPVVSGGGGGRSVKAAWPGTVSDNT